MVSGQFQRFCFCFVTALLTVVAPVELSFSADEERLPALVEQFCAHHAVRRGPCASLVSHAESLRTAAAAAREAIVRFDVAIDRRVPLEVNGVSQLWDIELTAEAAHRFCARHAIASCAALVRAVEIEARERRAMVDGVVHVEVNGVIFARTETTHARWRRDVERAVRAHHSPGGAAPALTVAIWSQTLHAASGYVAGSEITSAGLARAFRDERGALTLRFGGSLASNASHGES